MKVSLSANLKNSLPPQFVHFLRSIKHFDQEQKVAKSKKELFGEAADMVPPLFLITEGWKDYAIYKKYADNYLDYFINLCDLKPSGQVLEVGSGSAKIAICLTQYLDQNGSYHGLDIQNDAIDWCQRKISTRYSNFHFQKIKVFNAFYNRHESTLASAYKFPFEDNSFDLVVLGSVFTHMLPDDMQNYLQEIHRVLKPNGKALITYFLLNTESVELLDRSSTYPHKLGRCRVEDPLCPEQVIAHPEDEVLQSYEKLGLKIIRKIYGNWCGRPNNEAIQDVIISVKS